MGLFPQSQKRIVYEELLTSSNHDVRVDFISVIKDLTSAVAQSLGLTFCEELDGSPEPDIAIPVGDAAERGRRCRAIALCESTRGFGRKVYLLKARV